MATPAPPPEDLEAAFGGGDMPPAEGEMPDTDEMGADEEALDMAIDEAFEAEDPVARREAFKNAVRLCGHY